MVAQLESEAWPVSIRALDMALGAAFAVGLACADVTLVSAFRCAERTSSGAAAGSVRLEGANLKKLALCWRRLASAESWDAVAAISLAAPEFDWVTWSSCWMAWLI